MCIRDVSTAAVLGYFYFNVMVRIFGVDDLDDGGQVTLTRKDSCGPHAVIRFEMSPLEIGGGQVAVITEGYRL